MIKFLVLPVILQNLIISIYNFISYQKRYGGKYGHYLVEYSKNQKLPLIELEKIQKRKLKDFISFTLDNSNYYIDLLKDKKNDEVCIDDFPILKKDDLRKNVKSFLTIDKKGGIVSKTGGTTGTSLEVVFTKDDMQERFAMLDTFRKKQGYKLGKKTAWFSGKSLLSVRDIKRNIFWKTDYLYKVRYYSTFHINPKYIRFYLNNLIKFKPEFFVGFPSSIVEIARFGLINNIPFPKGIVKAIFPTAETITKEVRSEIESYFHAKMYDQYASSEGAPFIFECDEGNLHLELQSGIFEVLDNEDKPTSSGRLVVTSFTTHGTPLIRYDIGDNIILNTDKKVCGCGNRNPTVKEILGRIDDFIYSPENGKINLGNISNAAKGTVGIKKFQVVQNLLDQIDIKIVIDEEFNEKSKKKFLENWNDRLGKKMKIQLFEVDKIPVEKSGKFRLVKNNIKDRI
jgi:phenylacetate-CoA ligase